MKIKLSFFVIIIFILTSILFTNILKYISLSQEKTIEAYNKIIQNKVEVLSELSNSISELSKDERITKIAMEDLGMIIPESKNIICVEKNHISPGDYNYSFLNFISPEVIASDK